MADNAKSEPVNESVIQHLIEASSKGYDDAYNILMEIARNGNELAITYMREKVDQGYEAPIEILTNLAWSNNKSAARHLVDVAIKGNEFAKQCIKAAADSGFTELLDMLRVGILSPTFQATTSTNVESQTQSSSSLEHSATVIDELETKANNGDQSSIDKLIVLSNHNNNDAYNILMNLARKKNELAITYMKDVVAAGYHEPLDIFQDLAHKGDKSAAEYLIGLGRAGIEKAERIIIDALHCGNFTILKALPDNDAFTTKCLNSARYRVELWSRLRMLE